MAMVKLKTFKDPYYEYTTTLAGQSVKVQFLYNDYDEYWYFSLFDSEGDEIRSSIRLRCGGFFLLRYLSDTSYLYVLNKGTGKDRGIKAYNNFDVIIGW